MAFTPTIAQSFLRPLSQRCLADRSTIDTDKSYEHCDGKTYPYVTLDDSSASHPVYTGQERKAKTEGRVAGFNKRFAAFTSK